MTRTTTLSLSLARRSFAAAALPAVLAFAPVASAQSPVRPAMAAAPVVTADVNSISAAMKRLGFDLDADTDGVGDPKLSGKVDDLTFSIYFYGCDDDHANCKEIQFYGGFEKPDKIAPKKLAQRMLDWNRDKRFARGYIDKVGDPCIEQDVDMRGGMSVKLFESNFQHWRGMMQGFYGYIYAGD